MIRYKLKKDADEYNMPSAVLSSVSSSFSSECKHRTLSEIPLHTPPSPPLSPVMTLDISRVLDYYERVIVVGSVHGEAWSWVHSDIKENKDKQ